MKAYEDQLYASWRERIDQQLPQLLRKTVLAESGRATGGGGKMTSRAATWCNRHIVSVFCDKRQAMHVLF